jgi:hypothetical protein
VRVLWLADVLRAAGLNVVEHAGWKERGRSLQSVEGIVCHHTATGKSWTDQGVVNLLINGRSDLPGPLCQLGLGRDGTYHLIASGKGNHNGHGEWGNQAIGIEAFNDGIGEPWLHAQYGAYLRGCAAICRHLGWPESKVKGHKETDPRRKIDPRGIDMDDFRLGVAGLIKTITPAPAPPQEDDMARLIKTAGSDALFITDGITRRWVQGPTEAGRLLSTGLIPSTTAAVWEPVEMARVPLVGTPPPNQ